MVNIKVFWYRARIEVDERAARFFDYRGKSHEVGEGVIHRDIW